MRIINQIIILALIVFIVVAIKTDYKTIPTKIFSYIQDGIKKSSINFNNTNTDTAEKVVDNIKTPGALTAPDNYLTTNTKSINLTIKGVIEITNKYRKENGNLKSLTENSKLDFSAEKKLQDMFVKGYFEHTSPTGVGVSDLGAQVGYDYLIIGENLALGNFKDNQALVDAWMASPGHRANILNEKYTEIGVAVGKGVYQGKNVWMAVQHFALPKSACPSIDEALKSVIDANQKQSKEMEANLTAKKANIDNGAILDGETANDQINKYNELVGEYNKLISNIKKEINQYNEGVKAFNSCIEKIEE